MSGVMFAALAALTGGTKSILHRHVLKKEDGLSYAFIWHIIGGLLLLPLFILQFKLPVEQSVWFYVIASSIAWAAAAYAAFEAYTKLEVSTKTPITQSRLIFVLLLAVLFLKESLTAEKLTGTLLIIAGIIAVTYKNKEGATLKSKSTVLALIAAFFTAVALLIDKIASPQFPLGMYAFMVYLLPAVFLAPFALQKLGKISSLVKNNFKPTLTSSVLDVATYYLILNAFQFAEASIVVPIWQLSALVAVAGGVIFLREKITMQKIAGTAITILGAVIISGVYKIF